MEKVKLGIIGCGVIGTEHMKAAVNNINAELVAVADKIPERADAKGKEFNVPGIYYSADDLINADNVEAVVLAFQTNGRSQVAVKVLNNYKHVLIEKPVALNYADAKTIYDARKVGLIASGCSCRLSHFESAYIVKKAIEDGLIGNLQEIHVRALLGATEAPKINPPNWRQSNELNGGGILVNWGVYDMDFVFTLTGWKLKPKYVMAKMWPIEPTLNKRVDPCSDAESRYTALIVCEDGTVITFERGEFCAVKKETSWQFMGNIGTIRTSLLDHNDKKIYLDLADSKKGVVTSLIWEGTDDETLTHTQPITGFVNEILGLAEPFTTLDQAMFITRVSDAIYESANAGGVPVELKYN